MREGGQYGDAPLDGDGDGSVHAPRQRHVDQRQQVRHQKRKYKILIKNILNFHSKCNL